MIPEGSDKNEALRAEILADIERTFERISRLLQEEKRALIHQVEQQLSIPAKQVAKKQIVADTTSHIRALINTPSNYPEHPLSEIHVSARAFQIVADIRVAHNSKGWGDGSGPKYRKQYAFLAILAEAMLNQKGAVTEEQLATITTYSLKGIRAGIKDTDHILEQSGYRIVGDYSSGWRLVSQIPIA